MHATTATAQVTDHPKQPLSMQDRVAIVTPYFGFEPLNARLYDLPQQKAGAAARAVLDKAQTALEGDQLVTIADPGKSWDVGLQDGGCVLGTNVFATTEKRSQNAACAHELYLTSSKGDVPLLGFHVSPTDPLAVNKIVAVLEAQAKQANIRSLDNARSPLMSQVEIKLLPVEVVKDADGQAKAVPKGNEVNDGYQRQNLGNRFQLRILNNSSYDLYCAVLMLGTSGSVELITTNPHGDLIAATGSLLTFPPRVVGAPLGIETYKVIATTSPAVDFRTMEFPGAARGIGHSPLEWLLSQTTNVSVRDSSASADVDLNEWTTSSLDILVQQP